MYRVVTILEELKEVRVELEKELVRMKKIYSDSPEGCLVADKKYGKASVQYYLKCKGKKCKYLSKRKDSKLINSLGDKRFAKQAIKNLVCNIEAIDRFLAEVKPSIGVFLADDFENQGVPTTQRTSLSRAMRCKNWLENKKREKKKDMEENPEYYEKHKSSQFFNTLGGDVVRSKSEGLIADILFTNHIPYIYEARLELGAGRYKYPDFTVYDAVRDREIVYEHFGRMDDVGYVVKNFKKIELCVDHGMNLGKDFFITFETKDTPLTTKMVTDTLEKFAIKSIA